MKSLHLKGIIPNMSIRVPKVILERLPENVACSQCDRRFVCQRQLTLHEADEHNGGAETKKHALEESCKEASSRVTKRGRFLCKACGKSFSLAKYLNEHIFSKHPSTPEHSSSCKQFDRQTSESPASKLKVSQVFSCLKCKRHFATHQNLKRHENRAHQRIPHLFKCCYCGISFALQDMFNFHMMTSHEGLPRSERNDAAHPLNSSLSCTSKPEHNNNEEDYIANIDERPINNPNCGDVHVSLPECVQVTCCPQTAPPACLRGESCYTRQDTFSPNQREERKSFVNEANNFQCEDGEDDDIGVATYDNDPRRPFNCSKCFLNFAYSSSLTRHKCIVNKSRVFFLCSLCDREFSDQLNLVRHVRKHFPLHSEEASNHLTPNVNPSGSHTNPPFTHDVSEPTKDISKNCRPTGTASNANFMESKGEVCPNTSLILSAGNVPLNGGARAACMSPEGRFRGLTSNLGMKGRGFAGKTSGNIITESSHSLVGPCQNPLTDSESEEHASLSVKDFGNVENNVPCPPLLHCSGFQFTNRYYEDVAKSSLNDYQNIIICKQECDPCADINNQDESDPLKSKRKISAMSKIQRDHGLEHINSRGFLVRARRMGEGCTDGCRFKCHSKVSSQEREIIFSEYWGLGNNVLQWAYIARHTTVYVPKRVTAGRRSASRRYWFEVKGKFIKVCKSMFIGTLDISESLIRTATVKQKLGSKAFIDLRGKRTRRQVTSILKKRNRRRQKKEKHDMIEVPLSQKDQDFSQGDHPSTPALLTAECAAVSSEDMLNAVSPQEQDCKTLNSSPQDEALKVEFDPRVCIQVKTEPLEEIFNPNAAQLSSTQDESNAGANGKSVISTPDYRSSTSDSVKSLQCSATSIESMQHCNARGSSFLESNQQSQSTLNNSTETPVVECSFSNNTKSTGNLHFDSLQDNHHTEVANACYISSDARHQSSLLECIPDTGDVEFLPEYCSAESISSSCSKRPHKSIVSKLQRDHGFEHINSRGSLVRARQMGSGCSESCRFKCHSKITDDERQSIFNYYWGLGNNTLQWAYIAKCTTLYAPKKVTGGRRTASRRYWFEIGDRMVNVCKSMFVTTLDISDSIIKTAIVKQSFGPNSEKFSDMRGKHSKRSISASSEKRGKRKRKKNRKSVALIQMDETAPCPSSEPVPSSNWDHSISLDVTRSITHEGFISSDTVHSTFADEAPHGDAGNFKHSDSSNSFCNSHINDEASCTSMDNIHSIQMIESVKSEPSYEHDESSAKEAADAASVDSIVSCLASVSQNSDSCAEAIPENTKEDFIENLSPGTSDLSKPFATKSLRDHGIEHCNSRGQIVRGRKMGPGCGDSCRFKCQTKISEQERGFIFSEYWALGNNSLQWAFIAKSTTLYAPKKVTAGRRTASRRYWFEVGGRLINVCKSMFLNTLDISDSIINTAIVKQSTNFEEAPFTDKRGKHSKRYRAISDDMRQSVLDHVNSLPRVHSRCCEDDIVKEYLEEKVGSIANMYRLYKNWFEANSLKSSCRQVTERQYRDIFLKDFLGLSIFSSKRKCDLCSVQVHCKTSDNS